MDGDAPPPPEKNQRYCKRSISIFFSAEAGAGVELEGRDRQWESPVDFRTGHGPSRPKGPARMQHASESEAGGRLRHLHIKLRWGPRRQGTNEVQWPVDSRHLHHSLSQKVINYERPCSGKLYLPGVVFIRCVEDCLGGLYRQFFWAQKGLFFSYMRSRCKFLQTAKINHFLFSSFWFWRILGHILLCFQI